MTRFRFLWPLALLSWTDGWIRAVDAVDEYKYPDNVALQDGDTFDYIVVGAGAGGAAVASRLALANNQVLLLEAGGDPSLLSEIPGGAMGLMGSKIDWRYETISNNKSCLSSINQACRFARGKCLGGSTSINYMMYTRGNRKKDFEELRDIPGWTFDDLMPYFLRYEGLQDLDKLPASSRPYHNTTGTMRIGFFDDPKNAWHSRLKTAFRSLSFPENFDVNAESQIGFSQVIGYAYKGKRMSTARGYLSRKDVKQRLKVAKNATCTGVIIDDQKVAKGVTAVQGLRSVRLFAQKEVILSAGAIGTPQILLLSGVGPADHLESMGIPVKVTLPVGEGMTDHALPMLFVKVQGGSLERDKVQSIVAAATQLAEILVKLVGSAKANGLTDITAFINSRCYDQVLRQLVNKSYDGSDCEVPNLQIIHAYINRYLIKLAKRLVQRATGFNDNVMDQLSEANEDYAFITMEPVLLRPSSKGNVRLASKDPLARPAIFPNFLSCEKDLDDMTEFIAIVAQIVATPPFQDHASSLLHLQLDGCPRHEEGATQYWRCYVRHMTSPVYHAAGTAQLGAVVDERLRVRGVQRLRVADLSVLPFPPRANTEAVTLAIGERAAQFVMEDNKKNN